MHFTKVSMTLYYTIGVISHLYYGGDLKSDHLKSGNIQNRDHLISRLVQISDRHCILCSVFLPKPSHGGFGQFFPTGTYTGIGGTSVSSLKHVMKSTTKIKSICMYDLFSLKHVCTFMNEKKL